MKAHSLVLCIGTALAFLTATTGDAQTLRFTTINIPGAISTGANGINNAGVIVGNYEDSSHAYHGYILDGSNLTTLDNPNGTNTTVDHCNLNGTLQVVGSYTNSAGKSVGFMYSNGVYTDIPGPTGAVSSFANGINDDGVIVGGYTDSGNLTRAFVLKDGKYTTITIFMAQITIASGINDSGNVTVWYVNGLTGATRSRLYNSGTNTYTVIDVPGARDSLALDVNNSGDISYQWTDANYASHAAVLHQGTFIRFDYPGSNYDYADGINDTIQIVGAYTTVSNAQLSGFKATR